MSGGMSRSPFELKLKGNAAVGGALSIDNNSIPEEYKVLRYHWETAGPEGAIFIDRSMNIAPSGPAVSQWYLSTLYSSGIELLSMLKAPPTAALPFSFSSNGLRLIPPDITTSFVP